MLDGFFTVRSLSLAALIICCMGLMAWIIKKLRTLWPARTTVDRTSSFQIKMARAFALFVILPCFVVASFSVFFLHIGMHTWFNRLVQTAINGSDAISQHYLQEQKQLIEFQSRTLINELNQASSQSFPYPNSLDHESIGQDSLLINTKWLTILNRAEAMQGIHSMIFSCSLSTLSNQSSVVTIAPKALSTDGHWLTTLRLTHNDIRNAEQYGGYIRCTQDFKHLLEISPLDPPYSHTFVVICRTTNPTILERVSETHTAAHTYQEYREHRKSWISTVLIIFIFLTIILILIAMIGGLSFAQQTIGPIGALIQASEQVRQGQAPLIPTKNLTATTELRYLVQVFNSMSSEVSSKREALKKANNHLHNRNLFIESVLEGISSGVMSLDRSGAILFANSYAQTLFPQVSPLQGQNLMTLAPEFYPLFQQALRNTTIIHSDPVVLIRGNHMRTFRLHIQYLVLTDTVVVTMDDISTLISAQKKSAWSDVACRIAHEVKNPLTPISLSAERLRRRYIKEIQTEPEIFEDCIETIIRQVHHIGNLISEFSDFARLPAPQLGDTDLNVILVQMIVLLQQAYTNISFEYTPQTIQVYCDAQQIEQVLNNVFKNAIESIEETKRHDGCIHVVTKHHSDWFVLSIHDNGVGLSLEKALVLCEPYQTTKEQGMGLGLAIVQKIIDDHGGLFSIHPNINGVGVCVTISLLKQAPLCGHDQVQLSPLVHQPDAVRSP
ncbi:MAG: GHKL domain-containing protein [Alphaproteobacteria bacterium]|nr:GHKL domain-containing protein [Alphaproteobacteria bacterium]